MNRRPPLRESRLVQIAVGASMLAIPPSAAALAEPVHPDTVSPREQAVPPRIRIRLRRRQINLPGPRDVHIRGRMLPGQAGRWVALQGRRAGSWHTLASARTGTRGGFDLHYVPRQVGREQLRVRLEGDTPSAAGNRRTFGDGTPAGAGTITAPAGTVTLYQQSVASWYYDGGQTACGFHAYYGVANLALPCGTTVRFMSGGRTVTAVVDDRGPYVSGREWDLNQNTAAALGFDGVGSIWSSA